MWDREVRLPNAMKCLPASQRKVRHGYTCTFVQKNRIAGRAHLTSVTFRLKDITGGS